tara:strand:- start:1059 stop:1220 length:162 start_codon:yes stop_codon:yes gene_type:complete
MKHYVKTDDGYIVADSNEIEFLNIEEDFHGRDVMTFLYKGKEYKSLVVIANPQ